MKDQRCINMQQTYLWVLPKSLYWMMSFCCPFSATPSNVQTSVPNTVQINLVISKFVSGSSLQICTHVITSQNHICAENCKENLFLDFHRVARAKLAMDISMYCAMMWVNFRRQVSALPKYAPQIFPCHVLLHISCTILQFNETWDVQPNV
jgi:predicted nucleic acid-binding Zn ribbon protein